MFTNGKTFHKLPFIPANKMKKSFVLPNVCLSEIEKTSTASKWERLSAKHCKGSE